ncbi:BTAF1 [Lepeophtheirus salmonis]|uniref:BTAF1 n=1 Tax=Lepeophtheirus salmonis TaxID=72036 RepID=A0A7R8CZ74_LEPSM|nr:BTAF1 [Lepeophtheirus salmonis]CAF2974091.1 BTAF1 [Lepeophtheirus salmonis]
MKLKLEQTVGSCGYRFENCEKTNSRLDRLFILLKSGSSATRESAATQLGRLQSTNPEGLPHLLTRLSSVFKSPDWEARIAAGNALSAIFKSLEAWDPLEWKEENGERNEDCFSLKGGTFLRSESKNQESPQSSSLQDQRKHLDDTLGIKSQQLVTNEDLVPEASTPEEDVLAPPPPKRFKWDFESKEQSPNDSPLQPFIQIMFKDLFHESWEIRHGAATALREVLKYHGSSGGKVMNVSACENDHRFGDFASDTVVAPVRETGAQALGYAIKVMIEEDVQIVVDILLSLMERREWQCRHGGLLAVKYLLALREANRKKLLAQIFPSVFSGLQDTMDDVVSVAASSLLPVAELLPSTLSSSQLSDLTARLWDSLLDLDDLTASTHSLIKLLSSLLVSLKSDLYVMHSTSSLKDLVPRIYPLLSHSSSLVHAQLITDLEEKSAYMMRARILAAKLLGFLAGFVVQRVPNMTYTEDPMNQFVGKIILPNLLNTRSAYHRTTVCLVISEWNSLCSFDKSSLPDSKHNVMTTLSSVKKDQSILGTMTLAAIAGSAVSLCALPEKLHPLIKPLMESIREESNVQLQNKSADKLADPLFLRIVFLTPQLIQEVEDSGIITHFVREKSKLSYSARKKNYGSSKTTQSEEELTTSIVKMKNEIQRRGAIVALQAIVKKFGNLIELKIPKLWDSTIAKSFVPPEEDSSNPSDLVNALQALEVMISSLHIDLYSTLETSVNCLFVAEIASISPKVVMTTVIKTILPSLEVSHLAHRRGAIEVIICILDKLGVKIVPYIVLLLVPVLGRMSDTDSQDIEFLKEIKWNYIILDEGHIIKNAKAKTTIAIKSLSSNHRLILSGTPIQNSVLEIWSLFDFLMPGYLGSEREFSSKFSKPIIASRESKCSKRDKEAGALATESLHRQILPFVLRRMKEDVLKDLPPKITQDYYCDLSPLQIRLYEEYTLKQKLDDLDGNICNHPKLVSNELSVTQSQDISVAAKLPALKELLLECGIGIVEGEDNQLCLANIVENDLLKNLMPSVTYLRLDGSVPTNMRHEIVQRFNNDVSIDILLLSTSVGGLGLNLTGADTVIFAEHDWNPMKDLQAMDRAHRIGQKKVVNVYRLITRNTIEEKILGLQKFKLKTANTVISSENSSIESMATDQIFDLFSLEEKTKIKRDVLPSPLQGVEE